MQLFMMGFLWQGRGGVGPSAFLSCFRMISNKPHVNKFPDNLSEHGLGLRGSSLGFGILRESKN